MYIHLESEKIESKLTRCPFLESARYSISNKKLDKA